MIFKITHSATCGSILSYHLKKVSKGVAEISKDTFYEAEKNPSYYKEQPVSRLKEDYQFQLESVISQNVRVYKNKFLDISANFAHEDTGKLDEEERQAIIKEWIRAMGYANNEYLVFKHTDKKHTHYHIVTPTIDRNGKKVQEHNNFHRNVAVTRNLEKKFKLRELSYITTEKEDHSQSYNITGALKQARTKELIKENDPIIQPLKGHKWETMNNEKLSSCYQNVEDFTQLQEILKEHQCLKPNYKKQLEIDLLSVLNESSSFKEYEEKARRAGYYVRYIHHKEKYHYGAITSSPSTSKQAYYFKEDRLNVRLHASSLKNYFKEKKPLEAKEHIGTELKKALKTSYTLPMTIHKLAQKGIETKIIPPPPDKKRFPRLTFKSPLNPSISYDLTQLSYADNQLFRWNQLTQILGEETQKVKETPINKPEEIDDYSISLAIQKAIQQDAINIETPHLQPLLRKNPKNWMSMTNREIKTCYDESNEEKNEKDTYYNRLIKLLAITRFLEKPETDKEKKEQIIARAKRIVVQLKLGEETKKHHLKQLFNHPEKTINRTLENTLRDKNIDTWQAFQHALRTQHIYLEQIPPDPQLPQPQEPKLIYILKNSRLDPTKERTLTQEKVNLSFAEINNRLRENREKKTLETPANEEQSHKEPLPHREEWTEILQENLDKLLQKTEMDSWPQLQRKLEKEDITIETYKDKNNIIQTAFEIKLTDTEATKVQRINGEEVGYNTEHINTILNQHRLVNEENTSYPSPPSENVKDYVLRELQEATKEHTPNKEELEHSLRTKHIQMTYYTTTEGLPQMEFTTLNPDTKEREKVKITELDYPSTTLEKILTPTSPTPPTPPISLQTEEDKDNTPTPTSNKIIPATPASEKVKEYIKRHLKRTLREATSLQEFKDILKQKKIQVEYLNNVKGTYGVNLISLNPATNQLEKIKGSALEHPFKTIEWHLKENAKRQERKGTLALHPHKKEAIATLNKIIPHALRITDPTSVKDFIELLKKTHIRTLVKEENNKIYNIAFFYEPLKEKYDQAIPIKELDFSLEKLEYIIRHKKENVRPEDMTENYQKTEKQYQEKLQQAEERSQLVRYIKEKVEGAFQDKDTTNFETLEKALLQEDIIIEKKDKSLDFRIKTSKETSIPININEIGYNPAQFEWHLIRNQAEKDNPKEKYDSIPPYASLQKKVPHLEKISNRMPKVLGRLASCTSPINDNAVQQVEKAMYLAKKETARIKQQQQEEQQELDNLEKGFQPEL